MENGKCWVTKDDLILFRNELLKEIRLVIFEATKQRDQKKWLKSIEVRRLLGISPGKLQTMRKSGVLKFIKIGGAIYYEETDIQEMFEINKVKGKV